MLRGSGPYSIWQKRLDRVRTDCAAAPLTLDVNALEAQLRMTKAIGVFTEIPSARSLHAGALIR